jgi:predicted phosphodiesterase
MDTFPFARSLACLADIHGNTAALEAVLATPEFAAADAVAFLGCTTTGPDPLGVLELCQSTGKPAVFIAGNGERGVLEVAADPAARDWQTGSWLVQAHGQGGLTTIGSWPATTTAEVAGLGWLRLCHGSPRSDIETLTPETTAERIAEATAGISERVVVHGHTHMQYERQVGGVRVIAPGSVGLPYTTGPFGARWAVVGPEVALLSTPYEYETVRQPGRALPGHAGESARPGGDRGRVRSQALLRLALTRLVPVRR